MLDHRQLIDGWRWSCLFDLPTSVLRSRNAVAVACRCAVQWRQQRDKLSFRMWLFMLLLFSFLFSSAHISVYDFYRRLCRATACNATHGIGVAILSVCLSVRLSARRVYCDKTKWWIADILTPHETAISDTKIALPPSVSNNRRSGL